MTATPPLISTACTDKLKVAWAKRGWVAFPAESKESTTPGTTRAARDLFVAAWSKRAWPTDLTTVTGLKHMGRAERPTMSPETSLFLNLSLREFPPSQSPPSVVSLIPSCTRVWIPTLKRAESHLWQSLPRNRAQQSRRSHFPVPKLQGNHRSPAPFDPVSGA